MDEREVIAERIIYAIDKDSRGFDVALMIGKPYQADSKYGDWGCPVAMIGLHGVFPDMYGVDSWQALTIAHTLVKRLLTGFVEEGGRLFWEKDGEELTIDELFIGPPPETPEPDGPPTEEQQERINRLTAEELQVIDGALLAGASLQFRKVARVVGEAMEVDRETFKLVPDVFYASRVRKLVEEGRLVAEGNLDYMRFSEVKLPE